MPKVRAIYFLIGCCLASLLSGCGRDEVSVEIPFQRSFEISAGLSQLAEHHHLLHNFTLEYDDLLASNNLTDEKISQIVPTKARLSVFTGDNNLSWLEDAEIHIFDRLNPDDEMIIFFRDNIPFNQDATLDFVANNIDVRKFLKLSSFSVDFILKNLRRNVPTQYEVILTFEFGIIE